MLVAATTGPVPPRPVAPRQYLPGGLAQIWTINELIGYDPATGARLWTLAAPDDGQGIPAVVVGSTVVVSQHGGTMEGVAARTGHVEWTDPPPSGCRTLLAGAGFTAAEILAAGPTVVVNYDCADHDRVSGIVTATGERLWVWATRVRLAVNWQESIESGDGVVGVPLVQETGLAVPQVQWRLPPFGSPTGENPDEIVVLSLATGQPLWEMDGVPSQLAVWVGADELCATTPVGVQCRQSGSGAGGWQWAPSVEPPGGVGSTPMENGPQAGVEVSGGRLYWAAPTGTASRTTFQLRVDSLVSGAVVSDASLPFLRGTTVSSPPAVVGVADGIVLVAAQFGGDLIEAFRAPDH